MENNNELYDNSEDKQLTHNKGCFKARIIEKEELSYSPQTGVIMKDFIFDREKSEKCIIGIEDCKGCNGICRQTC